MNLRPSSSPTGRSSENGVSAQEPFTLSSFSCGMPVSRSSSGSVGSRPGAGEHRLRRALDAVVRVEHVHGDAHGAALVGERAADGVADPPRRVRREAVAARVVEALDRLHQADVALLDQVDERQPAAVVAARDAHDEAQVRLHELVLHEARARRRPRRSSRCTCLYAARRRDVRLARPLRSPSTPLFDPRRACASRSSSSGSSPSLRTISSAWAIQRRSLSARRMAFASEAHQSRYFFSCGRVSLLRCFLNVLSSLRTSAICGSSMASSPGGQILLQRVERVLRRRQCRRGSPPSGRPRRSRRRWRSRALRRGPSRGASPSRGSTARASSRRRPPRSPCRLGCLRGGDPTRTRRAGRRVTGGRRHRTLLRPSRSPAAGRAARADARRVLLELVVHGRFRFRLLLDRGSRRLLFVARSVLGGGGAAGLAHGRVLLAGRAGASRVGGRYGWTSSLQLPFPCRGRRTRSPAAPACGRFAFAPGAVLARLRLRHSSRAGCRSFSDREMVGAGHGPSRHRRRYSVR